jgi:endonuclease YncB( thermonuclease family)
MHKKTLTALLGTLMTFSIQAADLSGRIVNVYSGQELTIITATGGRHPIRLNGIRLPDEPIRQQAAHSRLNGLVAGRFTLFQHSGQRQNGQLMGKLLLGGADINLRLLKEGLVKLDTTTLELKDKILYEAELKETKRLEEQKESKERKHAH